jgi:3-hydroxyacyl-CoA dehydrogenase
VTDFMVSLGGTCWAKGVVVCKDTPNFIGNRFFAVAASYGIEHGLQNGYTIAEIDAITGPHIGRPKTATFRLMDLVGLDVMGHVNNNLYEGVPHDRYRDILKAGENGRCHEPNDRKQMARQQDRAGFLQTRFCRRQRVFLTLDPETMEYVDGGKPRFDSISATRKVEDLGERLRKLLAFDDRAANYARDVLYFGFAYAAYVAPGNRLQTQRR